MTEYSLTQARFDDLAFPVMLNPDWPRPRGSRCYMLACVARGCPMTFSAYVDDFEALEQAAQDAGWAVIDEYLCSVHVPPVCGRCLESACVCSTGDW